MFVGNFGARRVRPIHAHVNTIRANLKAHTLSPARRRRLAADFRHDLRAVVVVNAKLFRLAAPVRGNLLRTFGRHKPAAGFERSPIVRRKFTQRQNAHRLIQRRRHIKRQTPQYTTSHTNPPIQMCPQFRRKKNTCLYGGCQRVLPVT